MPRDEPIGRYITVGLAPSSRHKVTNRVVVKSYIAGIKRGRIPQKQYNFIDGGKGEGGMRVRFLKLPKGGLFGLVGVGFGKTNRRYGSAKRREKGGGGGGGRKVRLPKRRDAARLVFVKTSVTFLRRTCFLKNDANKMSISLERWCLNEIYFPLAERATDDATRRIVETRYRERSEEDLSGGCS